MEGEQELFALRGEVQRLRVANAQFYQRGGASLAASSTNGPPVGGNIASSNFPSQATPERVVYIHKERKCPFFLVLKRTDTNKMYILNAL